VFLCISPSDSYAVSGYDNFFIAPPGPTAIQRPIRQILALGRKAGRRGSSNTFSVSNKGDSPLRSVSKRRHKQSEVAPREDTLLDHCVRSVEMAVGIEPQET
jgi:hypothetical protein